MLAFTPLSALADTGEEKTVNYVALGDSLAAGVYFDKSVGTGYADHIKSDLEFIGYEVKLDNQGQSGANSGDVLAKLMNNKELAIADIITISVGANDVLPALQPLQGPKLTPDKLQQTVVAR